MAVRFLFALVLFCLGSLAAEASPIRVRSGDHATFSRLVLYKAPFPRWTLVRRGNTYALSIEGATAFRTDEVFRYIGRTRIAELSDTGNGTLLIQLACVCHARAFPIRQGLVVDVIDGAADPDTSGPPKPVGEEPGRPALPSDPTSLIRHLATTTGIAGTVLPGRWAAEPAASAAGAGTSPRGPSTQRTASRDDGADLRRLLLEQIGRGASQGLVTLRLPDATASERGNDILGGVTPAPDPSSTSSGIGATTPTPDPFEPADGSEAASSEGITANVEVATVFDSADPEGGQKSPRTADGGACLPDTLFDLAHWGAEERWPPEFSLHAGDLVDARDRPVFARVLARARLFLFMGFGAEARLVLRAFVDGQTPETRAIEEIAASLDERGGGTAWIGESQLSCPGRVALWALLRHPVPQPKTQIDTDAVIRALAELPAHLRRMLGPRVAAILTSRHDDEASARARSVYERTSGEPTQAMRMVAAVDALRSGDPKAIDELRAIRSGTGKEAALALVKLIETELAAGRAPGDELLTEVLARVHEHRGTALEKDLNRVHIAGLLSGGRVDEAIRRLLPSDPAAGNAARTDLAEKDRRELSAKAVLQAASADLPPSTLAAAVRLARSLPPDRHTNAALRALAQRLIDEGLPRLARDLLSASGGPVTDEDRLLIARTYLAERNHEGALRALGELTSPEAEHLRGEILFRMGEFARARTLLEKAGDARAAATAAWLAGDFAAAARLAEGPLQALARRALSGMQESPLPDPQESPVATGAVERDGPSLAAGRALLERSSSLRELANALLSEGS